MLRFVQALQKPTDKVQYMRQISDEERRLLQRATDRHVRLQSFERERVYSLLIEAKRRNQWIACDCEPPPAKDLPPPMITICQRDDGLYFRRVIAYGSHAPSCMFFRPADKESDGDLSPDPRKPPRPSAYFGIYTNTKPRICTTDPTKELRDPARNTGDRLPRLGRNLYRLVSDAGTNRIFYGQPRDLNTQYEHIRAAARRILIAPGKPLNTFLWTTPVQITQAALQIKNTKDSWKGTHSPQGFVLLRCHAIVNENTLLTTHKGTVHQIPLRGTLYKPGRVGRQSSPYLALVTLAAHAASAYVDTVDAFLTPTLTEYDMFPVESSYERRVLEILLKISRSLIRKVREIVIEKPLFDIPVSNNRSCRPDFVFSSGNKKVVLEVMGSWEENYLERKTRTHPLMAEIGPRIDVDAHLAETTNQWPDLEAKLARQLYAFALAADESEGPAR